MRLLRHRWTIIQLVLAITVTLLLHRSISDRLAHLNGSYDPYTPPPLSAVQPSLVNILTLGHKHVYDDFFSLWLLQILMGEHPDTNAGDRLIATIDRVTRHKPKLETTYLLSCITVYETFKRPHDCQKISLQGISAFPNSWRLPMLQGFIHAFVLEEPAQAASFFKMAGARPNAPEWIHNVVDKLLAKNDLTTEDIQKGLSILQKFSQRPKIEDLINRMETLNK